MKSGLKVKRRRKKAKNQEEKTSKKICLCTSTQKVEMPLIKVAYLMLNFLNLKSFLSILFFWVASILSTLWTERSLHNFPFLPMSKMFWFSQKKIGPVQNRSACINIWNLIILQEWFVMLRVSLFVNPMPWKIKFEGPVQCTMKSILLEDLGI